MNRRTLFLGAHALTRHHMEKNPNDKYREVFSRALRFLYAKQKEKEAQKENNVSMQSTTSNTVVKEKTNDKTNTETNDKTNTETNEETNTKSIILPYREIEINGYTRHVCVKVDGPILLGKVNNMIFAWNTETHSMPVVSVKEDMDKNKIAFYVRLFVLERLKLDNISVNVKTNAKNIEYIKIPEEDGVWCNIFENGYIRGAVNGCPFTWNICKYQFAAMVDMPGFDGEITNVVGTQKIKDRLEKAGYENMQMIFDEIRRLAALSIAKKYIKSVVITNADDLKVIAYEDGSITSKIDGKYYNWNSTKDSINELDDKVKVAIKTVAATPKLLIEYIKKNGTIIATASNLSNQDNSSATA